MRRDLWLLRVLLLAVIGSVAYAGIAQGPPGRDPDNAPPGHGGVPPGQAKKQDRGDQGMPPGQAKKSGEDGRSMPPGQAKKYFRQEDRDQFYTHYRHDADRWRGRSRPVFVPGQPIARQYVVQAVPRSYWVGVVAPPPPGYAYGYYGGYVVAYSPTTRIIADVLDLVGAAMSR